MAPLQLLLLTIALLRTPSVCATTLNFDQFVAAFNRTYDTPAERAFRQKVFANNEQKMEALRESNPYAEFSAVTTRWSDMTEAEFTQSHGYAETPGLPCQDTPGQKPFPKLKPTKAPAPKGLDWVEKGATVPVKNQGKCGSCWAHGTTAVVEARLKIDSGSITSLSEQYLLDCDTARICSGCCGGLVEDTMSWLAGDSSAAHSGAGIPSEASYPYVSESGQDPTEGKCNETAKLIAKVTGFGVLERPASSADILSASTEYGVLAVAIDALAIRFYTGGIITNSTNCLNVNHVVAIVGYGTTSDGVDYYKVRNSYGTSFGEEGYFRISRNAAEACGMHGCVIAATGVSKLTTGN